MSAGRVVTHRPLSSRIASYYSFYKELITSYDEIGSIFPSSRALAEIMIRPMDSMTGQRRILEVGPGTGPFTRVILEKLHPSDQFAICEINSPLLRQLRKSLEVFGPYRAHRNQVTFFDGPVQKLPIDGSYNMIVCGLPFSIFEPETVDEIMGLFAKILAPGGHLTFFEYWGFRSLFTYLNWPSNRRRMQAVDQVIYSWQQKASLQGSFSKKICLRNFPPAKALDLSFSRAERSGSSN